MREELKGLIEKINKEGIQAAQIKAKEIEEQALRKADEILLKAKEKAGALAAEAKQRAAQTEARTKTLLAQAARDLLLSVRKELNAMLEGLIVSELDSALSAADLQPIIMELVKTHAKGAERSKEEKIIIGLKKDDADLLEKKFLSRLKEETKKGIILKASGQLRAGFTISFDEGRSCYDFTDRSLAEYIGQYLKPRLNEVLKSAIAD